MTNSYMNRALIILGLLFTAMIFINAALPPAGVKAPTPNLEAMMSASENNGVNEGKKLNGFQKFILKRVEKKLQRQEAKAAKKGQQGEVLEGNSLGSFIASVGGLILVLFAAIVLASVWGVILFFGISSLLALILGFKGLSKFRQAPDLYWGKGFAIAGIVMGSLGAIYFFAGLFACLANDCS